MSFITPAELALWQRGNFEFHLLDVRRAQARANDASEINHTAWLNPALWLDWKDTVPREHPVIVYCAHGHEISQGLTAALRAMGLDARHLVGGITAWNAAGLAVNPIGNAAGETT